MRFCRPRNSRRDQSGQTWARLSRLPRGHDLVDGNPVANVKLLQDATKLLMIMKDGQFHIEPQVAAADRLTDKTKRKNNKPSLREDGRPHCGRFFMTRKGRSPLRFQHRYRPMLTFPHISAPVIKRVPRRGLTPDSFRRILNRRKSNEKTGEKNVQINVIH